MEREAGVRLGSAEHAELMRSFEALKLGRLDREPRDVWRRGIIYQDGVVNAMFVAYRHGVARGLALAQDRE